MALTIDDYKQSGVKEFSSVPYRLKFLAELLDLPIIAVLDPDLIEDKRPKRKTFRYKLPNQIKENADQINVINYIGSD